MKKNVYLIFLILLNLSGFSQTIRKVNDPHIQAQANRAVYKRWGNFLPNPSYNFFGIQTNIHYTNTWGILAPNQNGRYRRGKDLRPLSPNGEQSQRMVANAVLNETTDQYRKESDVIGKTAESELYYYSGLFSEVDPLWNIYYKIELSPVLKYNKSNPLSLQAEVIQYLTETGVNEWYDGEMTRLQDRLKGAFNTDMDRGSRILNYHRIMKEYYLVRAQLNQHLLNAQTLMKMSKQTKKQNSGEDLKNTTWEKSSEEEMIKKIMEKSKT
jgi:hypothetical protein